MRGDDSRATFLEIQALTQFVRAVSADAGVRVTFDIPKGGTPYNNGKEIHMYELHSGMSKEDLYRMRGWITRACSHVANTDFNMIHRTPELNTPVEEDNLLREVFTVLADHRADKLALNQGYAGDKPTLTFVEEEYANKYVPQVREHASNMDDNSITSAATYALDLLARDKYLPGVGIHGEEVKELLEANTKKTKALKKILKYIPMLQDIADMNNAKAGTQAAFELAKRIVDDMKQNDDEDEKENDSEKDGDSGGDADGNEEESKTSVRQERHGLEPDSDKFSTDPKDLDAPTYDNNDLPKISGMEEYIWVDYPNHRLTIGHDVQHKAPYECSNFFSSIGEYTKNIERTIATCPTKSLQQKVKRLLQIHSRNITSYNQKRGKLSNKDAHRVLIKDAPGYNERIFNRKRDALSLDVSVSLLCDYSGSMAGSRIVNAVSATYLLADVLQSLGINHEIAGFTTMGKDIVHLLFKEFNRPNRTLLQDMGHGTSFLHANSDGDSILTASSRLARQRTKRKVLIVLSDGSPSCHKSGNASMLVEKVIKDMQDKVEIIGIGIETDYGKHLYPSWVTIPSSSHLEEGVLELLQHRIFNL